MRSVAGRGASRGRSRAIAFGALIVVLGACGGTDAPVTIERDAFIRTYADLRIAAVQTDTQRIALATRDSILDAHGVTAADLERFAEIHSADLDFMRDVWNEVELLMDRQPEVAN